MIDKEESHALITYIKVKARPNVRGVIIKPRGLDPKRKYRVSCGKQVLGIEYAAGEPGERAAGDSAPDLILHGDTIMNAGLIINESAAEMKGDFRGALIDIKECDP